MSLYGIKKKSKGGIFRLESLYNSVSLGVGRSSKLDIQLRRIKNKLKGKVAKEDIQRSIHLNSLVLDKLRSYERKIRFTIEDWKKELK